MALDLGAKAKNSMVYYTPGHIWDTIIEHPI
jgi:hypothetical protein